MPKQLVRAGAVLTGAALLLCAGTAVPARADVRVIFASQHTLRAESVRFEEDMAVVDFGGGNEMRVPGPDSREEARWRLPGGHRAAGGDLEEAIARAAEATGLEPALIAAVVEVESAFDPFAVSPKGAAGLMQIMPDTARTLALDDPFDAEANIAAGARLLKRLIERYDGDLDLALAAYNAGEGAVARYGGIPPFPETRNYVRLVRRQYERLLASDV